MRHRHTVIWLDHYEAIVMHVHPEGAESVRISSDRERENRQLHRKSGEPGAGHLPDDVDFYAAIAHALADSEVILVSGPGLAKTSFVRYLKHQHAEIARRIAAIETLDHPTEGQLKNYAQTNFTRLQRLGAL
jgi:stalled ribosome rescue protein Dom34